MATKLNLILYFFTLSSILFAQSRDIRFEHLSIEDGLSHNEVHKIIQDKYGYLWIATKDGLNKYDGYKFTVYRNEIGNFKSISSNEISTLYEDRSGELWIGTQTSGLHKFDRAGEKFIHYQPADYWPDLSSLKDSISSWTVSSIYESHHSGKDILWVACNNGLNKYDREINKFTLYTPEEKIAGKRANRIQSLAQDHSGKLWVGSWTDGLFIFDPEEEMFTRYSTDSQKFKTFKNQFVRQLIPTENKDKIILWMGTEQNGLYQIEPSTGKITHYFHKPDDPSSISAGAVLSIIESKRHDGNILWIGTESGLNKFDLKTKQFTRYTKDFSDPESLSDNYINDIFEDRSGVLWISTADGINKCDPQKVEFKHLMDKYYITSIHEASSGGENLLWLGTKNNGLVKFNSKNHEVTFYNINPGDKKGLSANGISSIIGSSHRDENILWLGTYNGLAKFEIKTEQRTYYYLNNSDPVHNITRSIAQDQKGIVWLATIGGYLYSFNPITLQFTKAGDHHELDYNEFFVVFVDKKNNVWVGSPEALKRLNRNSGKFVRYKEQVNFKRVITIYEDTDGILWTGTDKGLFKFDPESETSIRYTEKDGLPNHFINGILEDDHDNLWISTNNGISKFNKRNKTFRNYDLDDGLHSQTFNRNANYKNKNGEMYFGAAKGLSIFHPDRIKDNSYVPQTVITDFQIFNKSILPGTESPLNRAITETDEIILSHDQSIFSFEFAALDYHSPQKNKYAYQMEGVDPDWVYTNASRRFVTYTQLDPGEYMFKVKGSNNDGIWNETAKSIKIIMLPPWWRTNLAYILYVLLSGVLVFGIWRSQLKRERLKQQARMDHFEAEKLREVDRIKSHFFTNISHEFRTPLTLIQGPAKQIIDGNFKTNLKDQGEMILRNSKRLLNLINQILDLSKLESGQMKLQASRTDVIKLLKGLVFSFSSRAESKKITLEFNAEDDSIMGYADRDKLEKIITNLLSNAFKFTPEGGEVILDCGLLNADFDIEKKSKIQNQKSKTLKITITNTGPGIPPKQLDKIFDRFYQADTTYKKDGEGSGIGLALTKELVELHHGIINVECRGMNKHPPQSPLNRELSHTTFTILIPIGKKHLTKDEIVVETSISKVDDQVSQTVSSIEDRVSRIQKPASSIETRETSTEIRVPSILIVEDNPDVTTYIRSFFKADYQILTAENGKAGWQKTLKKYPDLIISDVMMPEMDGFELCKKIKSDQRTSHIPVILLTARADLDSKIEGLEFGADDYISKPFDAEELQVRTKNLIEQRRKLREKFSRLIEINLGEVAASSMDEQFLERLLTIFEKHLSESGYSTENFAREIGMSRSHLNRKLKALTDLSTHGFILNMRLKRAALLLKKRSGTVTEIAYTVGFHNPANFAKAFKNQYGQSPRDFIKK